MDQKPASSHRPSLKLHLLVLRCQVGDMAAFQQLYGQFSQRSLGFLKSFVSPTEAEDLNQEIWLKIYQRIAGLTNPNGFKTWLFQIARNRAVDYLRVHSRLAALHEAMEAEIKVEQLAYQDIGDFEFSAELTKGLNHLSAMHREVLVLHFLEGMDYEEIGLITGCAMGTIKSRMYHAKIKLKNLLRN